MDELEDLTQSDALRVPDNCLNFRDERCCLDGNSGRCLSCGYFEVENLDDYNITYGPRASSNTN